MHGYLIEFTLSMIENFIIVQIMDYYLNVKSRRFKYAFIISFSIFAQFIDTMNTPFRLAYPIIILLVYAYLNYKGSAILKLVISSVVFMTNAYLSQVIITSLEFFNIPVATLLMHDTLLYISLTLISKFLLVTIFFMINMLIKRFREITNTFNWTLLIVEIVIFFSASLYSFYVFVCEMVNATSAIFLLMFQAITFVVTIYFCYKYIKSMANQKELEELLKDRLLYVDKLKEESILYDHNMFRKNKMDNGLQKISEYLADNQIEQATSIINELKEDSTSFTRFGNDTLDFLINSKFDIMSHLNINFQAIVGNSLQDIESDDLVFMVGNLLDASINMIKANPSQEKANVKLEIVAVSAGVKLSIETKPIYNNMNMQETLEKIKPTLTTYHGLSCSMIKNDTHIYKLVFFTTGGNDGKVSKTFI